jgi:aryl-alcohol dehydrogenase-like predicted oxidoreductase
MNLSHAYFPRPSPEQGAAVLRHALDLGYDFLDTAMLYGFGANETLIGETLGSRRSEYVLASKGGMGRNPEGKRAIVSTPAVLAENCEESLKRLKTDVIDLYYLHRWDKQTPIEDTIGGMAELVRAGKVRAIGLSEVSAATLRKAHAVHPIAAIQSEYSLWTRNPEIAVLDTCRALGVGFVAFSPVGRGFLAGGVRDVSTLEPKDLRFGHPRFRQPHFAENLRLLPGLEEVARNAGVTPAQAVLAWVLAQDDLITAIPGTANESHVAENFAAGALTLSADALAALDALINRRTVSGARYSPTTQLEIDTEEFV